jgi:hypothetical protein
MLWLLIIVNIGECLATSSGNSQNAVDCVLRGEYHATVFSFGENEVDQVPRNANVPNPVRTGR